MVQILPQENDWSDAFSQLGSGLVQGYTNRADENALRKSIEQLGEDATPRQILNAITGTKTYSPAAKQNMLKNYLGVAEFEELQRKAKAQEGIQAQRNQMSLRGQPEQQDTESMVQNLVSQGYTPSEAQAIVDPAIPNSVKQDISGRVQGEIARGQRAVGMKPVEQPVSQEQEAQQIQNQEALADVSEEVVKAAEPPARQKEEWPKIAAPPNTTAAEQEKWRDKNQTFNNKLLRETKEKTKSRNNLLIRYNRLSDLNRSGKLPEGIGRVVLNPETGEPYAVASLVGAVNKETQDFVKTMNDFLVDAKDYFGARVTNFDVQAFKSRLPTLLNTKDGRRLIIEQMKMMEDLQIVHDLELEKALKHYGRNASYSDIQNVVDEKTVEKEEKIINKLNNLDQAVDYMDLMEKDPRFKDSILMQSPSGKFKAIPKKDVSEAESKGYIRW